MIAAVAREKILFGEAPHAATNENAADIDDIRKALGTEKLIVLGHSYGSHLGLTYIRRHGANVDRAMLGGVNGPDHRRRFPKDGDVLFARLDSVVKATPSLRAVRRWAA